MYVQLPFAPWIQSVQSKADKVLLWFNSLYDYEIFLATEDHRKRISDSKNLPLLLGIQVQGIVTLGDLRLL
jgi:hypothetical protein